MPPDEKVNAKVLPVAVTERLLRDLLNNRKWWDAMNVARGEPRFYTHRMVKRYRDCIRVCMKHQAREVTADAS